VANPFVQKLIWTVLAIGVYVLTVFVPEVGSDLKVIAGLIVGAVWINTKESTRTSVKPPPMGALLVLPLLLGCSGVQLPQSQEALDAKRSLDEVADRLDARLTVARGIFDVASFGLDSACGSSAGEICGKARVTASAVDGYLKAADDAIDLYRETGQHFDDAHKTLQEAERRVGELRTLIASLRQTLTRAKEVPDAVAQGKAPVGGGDDLGPLLQPAEAVTR
jgi:hypothetical protein